ncbi:1,2-phenylacetyl-CoA epoxidase subunit PaaE [Agrococcus casei]|uniref:1,2-phenylacetyl-CoA epoxidase subunit PaaE n=1 Tax=Agrococcus casei TaxID=343512 RepID=UPI003F8E1225
MAALNLGSTGAAPRRRASFHALRVKRVAPLTRDSVEVTFEVPDALHGQFDYLPGQHVALRAMVDEDELRRSYSICRPLKPGELSVAIKRDAGGVFSNWANDTLAVGDEMQVMSPQGTFTSNLPSFEHKHIVGIAAGSGITPIASLAHTVLESSPDSRFTLLYSNKSTMDVMFVEELADLKDAHPSRFALHHVLSREQRASPLMSGRLDQERLRTILESVILPHTVDEWFLCGPFELVQLVRDTLPEFGVDASHVRFELFTTGEPGSQPKRARPVELRKGDRVFDVRFQLDGQTSQVDSPVEANETILNAALRIRPDVPFACSGGVCGTCRARVIEGSVNMDENYALEPDEVERGYVLTCQSHPTSEKVTVDYDV